MHVCKTPVNLNSMKKKSYEVEFHTEVSDKQNHILGFWWSFLGNYQVFLSYQIFGLGPKFLESQASVCGTHCMHLVIHFLSIFLALYQNTFNE